MRRTALRVIDQLANGPATVTGLAAAVDKSQSWISEVIADLETEGLVRKNDRVELANTYEARLLTRILSELDAEAVLVGTREDVLNKLLERPRSANELESTGIAGSTVYRALADLRAAGVVAEDDGEYRITSDLLRDFLEARTVDTTRVRDAKEEQIGVGGLDGTPTAFSAFGRYGIDYQPAEAYRYQGEEDIGRADVLMHAVALAETKTQLAMAAVFYLKHRVSLDPDDLWRLAGTWDCVERWADLLAYLDRREVKQPELFLPWEEFLSLARDYDVYPRQQFPGDRLTRGFEELGSALEQDVEAYLLGGANLILRGIKDSTKDLDLVVDDKRTFRVLVEVLRELGYRERRDLERAYEKLDPSIVLERDGAPRWDVFVRTVANALTLTDDMRARADQKHEFGNLTVHLLSVTDIVLFKAITDREGDLEDVAAIARQATVDWQRLLAELERQGTETGQYFSFAVLDTLDVLADRYGIDPPARERLVTYCLERALVLSLDEPKTIRDLRDELNFPDHRIYNALRRLEEAGTVEVDRSGMLNTYQLVR